MPGIKTRTTTHIENLFTANVFWLEMLLIKTILNKLIEIILKLFFPIFGFLSRPPMIRIFALHNTQLMSQLLMKVPKMLVIKNSLFDTKAVAVTLFVRYQDPTVLQQLNNLRSLA